MSNLLEFGSWQPEARGWETADRPTRLHSQGSERVVKVDGAHQPLHGTLIPALRAVALGRETRQAEPELRRDAGERGPHWESHHGCGARRASIVTLDRGPS